jgi:hypothetical protein
VQFQDAISQLSHRIKLYEYQTKDLYNGIAGQNIEVNLEYFNRYLQTVLTNTLANYAQAFLAAMDGKTSPYALFASKLQILASQAHGEKRITGFGKTDQDYWVKAHCYQQN